MPSASASANGRALTVGRDDVVDGGEGAVRARDLQAEVAQHPEGLRARHLVDQMESDEDLRLAVRQRPHDVPVPDLLEETLAHRPTLLVRRAVSARRPPSAGLRPEAPSLARVLD